MLIGFPLSTNERYVMNNYPPIQTSTPAFHGEVIDQLNEQISALNTEIADHKLSNIAANKRIDSFYSQIDNMIEGLMDMVTFGKIDRDPAEELASYFGRDLVRTVTVRLTVDIDAEVTIPAGYDLDDLHGDLEVEVSPLYSADIQIDSFETHGVQVEEM
jgi:hypothetical protein